MTEYTFYKLECINGSTDEFYIGSTNNLFNRQSVTKQRIKDLSKVDKKHACMRLHGGFDNWKWVTLEVGLYALELLAHVREQQLIDLHQPTLNTMRAYQTVEQKKEEHKAIQKKYRHSHQDIIKSKRDANKDIIKAKYDENRDQYNAKRRATAASKKALLQQPVLSVEDEPISPHAESVH
jgi:hypothetical protein